MTKPLRATQAEIRATIAAARSSGLRVLAVKPDGTVIVNDGDGVNPFLPLAPNGAEHDDASQWGEVEA